MRLSAEGRRVLTASLIADMRDEAAMQEWLAEVGRKAAVCDPGEDVPVKIPARFTRDALVKYVWINPMLFTPDP